MRSGGLFDDLVSFVDEIGDNDSVDLIFLSLIEYMLVIDYHFHALSIAEKITNRFSNPTEGQISLTSSNKCRSS